MDAVEVEKLVSGFWRDLLKACPLCGNDLQHHSLVLVASVGWERPDAAKELGRIREALRAFDWAEVARHLDNEYDSEMPAVEVSLLSCPIGRAAMLLEVLVTAWLGNPAVWNRYPIEATELPDLLPHVRNRERFILGAPVQGRTSR